MSETVKQINVRTLLRNFSSVKNTLISEPGTVYQVKLDQENTIEVRMVNEKKENISRILNSVRKLPASFKVKKINLEEEDLLPKRLWKK